MIRGERSIRPSSTYRKNTASIAAAVHGSAGVAISAAVPACTPMIEMPSATMRGPRCCRLGRGASPTKISRPSGRTSSDDPAKAAGWPVTSKTTSNDPPRRSTASTTGAATISSAPPACARASLSASVSMATMRRAPAMRRYRTSSWPSSPRPTTAAVSPNVKLARRRAHCVVTASDDHAACSVGTPSGMGTTSRASTTNASACGVKEKTRAPGRTVSTPVPMASTRDTMEYPGAKGYCTHSAQKVRGSNSPRRHVSSVPTLTSDMSATQRISPGWGAVRSTSTMSISRGAGNRRPRACIRIRHPVGTRPRRAPARCLGRIERRRHELAHPTRSCGQGLRMR